MSAATNGEQVLVTGGSGYIGSWTIVALLRAGLRVRATLRSLAREAEVRAAIAGAVDADSAERLSFVAADLLRDDGWAAAFAGVQSVVHVASPLAVGNARAVDLVATARHGTARVLGAAARAGVRRVVMTSSVIAAQPPPDRPADAPPIDETQWTDLGRGHHVDYARSKTLAEQDAWKLARETGLELVTVLPALVQGPLLLRDFAGSVSLVARLLTGQLPRLPRLAFCVVDVRDVADLHLRALQTPAAAGERFIGAGPSLWVADMARILRERLGARAARVPTKMAPDLLIRAVALFDRDLRQVLPNLGRQRVFVSAKAERLLGWRPRPVADTLVDGAESLLRHGLLQ